MDFHAAMETFAEAWVAANTQTAVNSDPQSLKPSALEDLPTLLPKEQLIDPRLSSGSSCKAERPSSNPNPHQPPSINGGKPLPIHCIIEQTTGAPTFDGSGAGHTTVELDSYAILPGSTPLNELVRTALIKLGYTATKIMGAKGVIQLKNWSPLEFGMITDNLQATVEEILGDLTSVATLRIRLCSQSQQSSTEEVKDKLLQLLLPQSQGLLVSTGCPVEALMLSVSKGENKTEISEEKRQAFDKWYAEQLRKLVKETPPKPTPPPPPPPSLPVQSHSAQQNVVANVKISQASTSLVQSPPYSLPHGRTRMRTSFDPEHEIPRLQHWFQQNQHPTREQMVHYLNELNSLKSRKGRKQLDLTNIIYWFKNARAALRRASKSMENNIVEAGDSGDSRPYQNSNEHLPFLPNRNAVYVVPHPLHCSLAKENNSSVFEENHQSEIDTSHHKQADTAPSQSVEIYQQTAISFLQKSPVQDSFKEKIVDKPKSVEIDNLPLKEHYKSLESVDLEEKELDEEEEEEENYYEASKCKAENMTDGHLSGDDNNRSMDNDSVSTQELDNCNVIIKQEISVEKQEFNNTKPLSLAYIPQALQVPHLPHSVPMHYLPYNAQYCTHLQEKSLSKGHSQGLEKKRRTRVFIDPLTEIPKLEKWFADETHPSAYMIDKYCEELNQSEYRQKFPKLESKNVQLWFKNHRAKMKRLRLDFVEKPPVSGMSEIIPCSHHQGLDFLNLDDYIMLMDTGKITKIWISGNDIEWTDQSVRTAVISLLKDHSQSLLAKLSPLSQSMISNIANWKYINKLSAEKCREFGEWYNRYKSVANGNYSNGCPRDSRLTFHPQHELPLMRDWYRTCRSPSHEKFVQFAEELNKGQVRQERPKVTTAKLKIWWKNEKQRERKHQKLQSCSGMKMDPTLASNSNICQDMTLSRCPDMSMDGSTNLVELL